MLLLVLAVACPAMRAQDVDGEPLRVGPGVTPPKLRHKKEPEFTAQARDAHVQGTVVLRLIVNKDGRPTDVTVISPLGFGLDERAVDTVKTWTFVPGQKNGQAVPILAHVEVNFRFLEEWFDQTQEDRRTAFNVAVSTLNNPKASEQSRELAVKRIRELAEKRFPAAQYLLGQWQIEGKYGLSGKSAGLQLLEQAAKKDYGPAIYELALRRIQGTDLPRDPDLGMAEMQQASILGSMGAQFYLGNVYERGIGVTRDVERAARAFRLCAARGVPECQVRLGAILMAKEPRPERDYLQAVAWFQLAADQGFATGQRIVDQEKPKLSPDQLKWVQSLTKQLVQNQI